MLHVGCGCPFIVVARPSQTCQNERKEIRHPTSVFMEEFKVTGEKLKDKLKELIREGNVRRIILKNPKGRVLLDMPLNAGVVGLALAPFWAAVAAVAVLATDYTVGVERDKTTAVTKAEPPPERKA